MNPQQWLDQATRDLPEGVAGRVSRETRAHLQDAGMLEGADVWEVLGDPETTNDELRRLYLTRKEWEELRATTGEQSWQDFAEWAPWLLPVLLVLGTWANPAEWWPLLLYVPALLLTGRLHRVRRRQWRFWLFNLLAFTIYVPDLMENATAKALALLMFLGLAVVSVANFLRRDARLRRTLLAEEGRA